MARPDRAAVRTRFSVGRVCEAVRQQPDPPDRANAVRRTAGAWPERLASSPVTMSRHLRISDAVVVRDLDGESVILNTESGIYFGLDRIGTRMWQLIEEHGNVDAIVRGMEHEYDADPG